MLRLWKAFLSTCDGLRWAMRNEVAIRQELIVLAVAVPLSFLVADVALWRIALIGSPTILVIVELLNTAIEKLADHVAPERSAAIKIVKDLGSAAVFLALVIAGMIWLVALIAKVA